MKRILSILLSLLLSISMLVPQIVLAAEDTDASPSAQTDTTENDVSEEVQAEYTFDPYFIVKMPELYDSGKLILPESMTSPASEDSDAPKVTVSKTKYRNGILLKGKVEDLTSGLIEIADEFDFDRAPVGRICLDALSDRTPDVTANVFLDDSDTPVMSVKLRKQQGKKEWYNNGDISIDIMDSAITGKHKVYIGFEISGLKPTKSTAIALRSIEFCETTIPVLFFHIDESLGSISAMNGSPDHSAECYGTVDLKVPAAFNDDETFRGDYGVQQSLTGLKLEYIRGRGNSTWDADKKPYKVKFEKKQELFGFDANKHWVLLANRFDNSLVRNRMTYWLGRKLGLDYTPDCVPVEVVMNGEYYGSYLLCEQIRIGKGRVDIDDLDDNPQSDDPFINSGGYLLSMEAGDEEDDPKAFQTKQGMSMYIESPSFDDGVNQYQLDYIKAFVESTEAAIFGKNFEDTQGRSYTEYLDFDSAVDYWWVQEFSANGDAYSSGSTYLYKKRDPSNEQHEKLYWGPLWDFDYVAWGDLDYDIEPPEGLDYTSNAWSGRLFSNKTFLDRIKSRWSEEGGLCDLLNQITADDGILAKYMAQMETSYKYDHEKYGSFEGNDDETSRPYKNEIDQLRAWILARKANVETALSEISTVEHTVKFVLDGKTIDVITLLHGSPLPFIPAAPDRKGYLFEGWCDSEGFAYTESMIIEADTVLTGRYVKEDKAIAPKNLYFDTYDKYFLCYASDFEQSESNIIDFSYRILPDNATAGRVTWSSSNESVASFNSDGELIGHSFGDAVITGKLWNGVSKSFKLHILDNEKNEYNDAAEVTISSRAIKLEQGKYTQLTATLSPQPCFTMEHAWISSDPDVADIDSLGIITANEPGTAVIVYYLPDNGNIQTCKVTVTKSKAALIKEAKARQVSIKVKSLKKHKQKLTWKKSAGASGYYIYRSTKKNGKYKKIATVKKGSTVKWTSGKLKRGKRYYYRVKPFTRISGKIYEGKWSNKAGAKVR